MKVRPVVTYEVTALVRITTEEIITFQVRNCINRDQAERAVRENPTHLHIVRRYENCQSMDVAYISHVEPVR